MDSKTNNYAMAVLSLIFLTSALLRNMFRNSEDFFFFQPTGADFVLEVMPHSYSNPESREIAVNRGWCEGGGCDPASSGSCLCDNQFTFCLREAASTAPVDDCSQGQALVTRVFPDNDALDFEGMTDLGNGVTNPHKEYNILIGLNEAIF